MVTSETLMTHDEMVAQWMQDPEICAEVERLEREEMPMLDAILKVRKEVGLTQAQIAERMKTSIPAVSRLENALITGKPSPSLATLKKYAAAMGKTVQISFV